MVGLFLQYLKWVGTFLSRYSEGLFHRTLKVIGIRLLAPVQNSVSLKIMQRETLIFVINLPGIENITKWPDPILTKVSIIKRFYTLEFILSVQSQIFSILNIVISRKN